MENVPTVSANVRGEPVVTQGHILYTGGGMSMCAYSGMCTWVLGSTILRYLLMVASLFICLYHKMHFGGAWLFHGYFKYEACISYVAVER